MLHRTVWDAQSPSSIKKLVLVYKQEYDMLHGTVWDTLSAVRKRS